MAEKEITLYVKGMSPTEIEDVWDDTILNKAYDKALKIANEEVAKRIAMDTCTSSKKENKNKSGKCKDKAKKVSSNREPAEAIKWQEGMPCRAIYHEDGLEYEAFVVSLLDDEDCIVKFIGYENSERVAISSLKPSQGNEARLVQMNGYGERQDDGFESQDASESIDFCSDDRSTPELASMQKNKKKKSNNKKKNSHGMQFGDLPTLPTLPMPNMDMIRNMCGMDAPLPPPPPLASLAGSDAEQQAISDMLLSWYMSGYYTGLYQGMRRERQNRVHH